MGSPPPGGWYAWGQRGGATTMSPGGANDPNTQVPRVNLADIINSVGGSAGKVVGSVANPYDPWSASIDALKSVPRPEAMSLEDPTHAYDPKAFAYTQKDWTQSPEFNAIRERINQQYGAQYKQGQEQLDRAFAANGMGNSGAHIKQMQLLDQNVNQGRNQSLSDLSYQGLGMNQQEQGRAFQSQMAGAQAQYGAQQAARGRNFARQQYNTGIPFQYGAFQFEGNTKLAALHQQSQQLNLSQQALEEQRYQDSINSKIAAYQAGHSGGLFGGGGFLGLGIGAGSVDF